MTPENTENRPTAFAAEPMAPSDIQATFFDGKPFTASTTSGTQFKMTFTPDGKMTRQPRGKSGKKSSGTWKLDSTGFARAERVPKPTATLSFRAGRLSGRSKRAPLLLQCGPNSFERGARLVTPPADIIALPLRGPAR